KAKYAVCVPTGMKDQLKQVLDAKKYLAQVVAEHRLITSDENDFVGIVTPAGVSKFIGLAKLGIEIAQKEIERSDDPNAEAAAAVFGVYKSMFESAAKEVTYVTVSTALQGRGGMRAGAQVVFKKDGTWAKMVAKGEVAPRDLLAGLPVSDYAFAGGMTWSSAWMDSMLDMSLNMMKAMPNLYGKLSDKQLAELRETWKDMMDIKSMSLVMGTPNKEKPWMSTIAATMEVDDAKKYMKNYAKAMKDYVKLMPKPGPLTPKYEMRQIEVGADKRLGVEFEMEFALPPGAETQGFEALFGNDKKLAAYIAAADEDKLVMTYDSKERLEALIKGVSKPGLEADKNIKATNSLLVDKPFMAFYVSPSGIFKTVRYFADMMKPGAAADIPAFPKTPPIGFAARASSDRLTFDAVVPDALIDAAADYSKGLMERERAR
ncbi:MAG: hypothetical protein MI757_09995, partial [Pirellulales bacterium]|nr:hypothetical protein [Pirellulales bacterium]